VCAGNVAPCIYNHKDRWR